MNPSIPATPSTAPSPAPQPGEPISAEARQAATEAFENMPRHQEYEEYEDWKLRAVDQIAPDIQRAITTARAADAQRIAELERERDAQKGRIYRLEREAIETRDLCELTPQEDALIQDLSQTRTQLRLCEEHAGTMAKDFDASLAIVRKEKAGLVAALELASLNVKNREDYSTKLEASRLEICRERDTLRTEILEVRASRVAWAEETGTLRTELTAARTQVKQSAADTERLDKVLQLERADLDDELVRFEIGRSTRESIRHRILRIDAARASTSGDGTTKPFGKQACEPSGNGPIDPTA